MKQFVKSEEKSIADKLLDKELEAIEVDKPVSECIDEFLEPYSKQIEPYIHYAKSENKLKYLLMKRFIFTAFNNLVEMDLDMSNSNVLSSKKKLTFVQKDYDDLLFQLKKPVDLTYESIFLNKQTSFNSVLKEQDSKRKTAELYKSRAKVAEGKMMELKDVAAGYSAGSKHHKEIMSKYRKLNGSYTDYIHKMAVLKEEANALSDYIVKFRSEHKIQFSQVFHVLGERILNTILQILDALAHEFDSILWEEAKESRIIRKFFEDAQIEGGYSSRTFLKYYLKNISQTSQNQEHKDLRKLLEYLENSSSRKIFILGNDNDRISNSRYALEAADKNISVLGAIDPEKLITECKKKNINLLIIDFNLRNNDSVDVIHEIWKKFPSLKDTMKILMLFHDPSYEEVNLAGKSGVKHFLRYDQAEKHLFINKVREILN